MILSWSVVRYAQNSTDENLQMIQAARRLHKTPGQHLTLGQVVELNRRFMEGYDHFKKEPKVQELRIKVLKYNRLVRDLGLRDHQVWLKNLGCAFSDMPKGT